MLSNKEPLGLLQVATVNSDRSVCRWCLYNNL